MTDDEFDEMLKARHNAFVADVATVIRHAHRPAVVSPPAASRIAVLPAVVRPWLVSVANRFSSAVAMNSASWVGVTLALLAVVLVGTGQPALEPANHPQMAAPTLPAPTPPAPTPSVSLPELTIVPLGVPPLLSKDSRTQVVMRSEIVFEADSVALSETGSIRLWDLTGRVRQDDRITVVGHTARVGSADTAVELSRRRADAVGLALTNYGVAASRITIIGRGYEYARPDVDARDRRVEVAVWRKA